jgi:hypothetical protein
VRRSPAHRRLPPVICALLLAAALAITAAPATSARPLPGAPRCSIFPADNPWNQRVDRLPVASNSAALIAAIGLTAPVHPDFGSGLYDGAPIGIPITVVSGATPRVRASFTYAPQSDRGPYPMPRHPLIEGGPSATGDRHVLMVDRDSCRDYELYDAHPAPAGSCRPPADSADRPARFGCWRAGSGAIFDLHSDRLRPAGWTSADAAGLPILPGLVRFDEVRAGAIDHALRFTAPCTAAHYVYPARHFASTCRGGHLPPMGLRVRLKAGVDIAPLPFQARVVARALKRYGMILADNGSPWYISGAPDGGWNNAALHLLDRLDGRDFEVVNTASAPHPG